MLNRCFIKTQNDDGEPLYGEMGFKVERVVNKNAVLCLNFKKKIKNLVF